MQMKIYNKKDNIQEGNVDNIKTSVSEQQNNKKSLDNFHQRVNVPITWTIVKGHETIANRCILTFWTSFLSCKTTANSPLRSYSGQNILYLHI